jgi:hypothetical protein
MFGVVPMGSIERADMPVLMNRRLSEGCFNYGGPSHDQAIDSFNSSDVGKAGGLRSGFVIAESTVEGAEPLSLLGDGRSLETRSPDGMRQREKWSSVTTVRREMSAGRESEIEGGGSRDTGAHLTNARVQCHHGPQDEHEHEHEHEQEHEQHLDMYLR